MEKVPGRKEWPCVDPECMVDVFVNGEAVKRRTNLGTVVDGELAVDLSNVSVISSNGVNMVLTCAVCGKPKTWFAKESACLIAVENYRARRSAQELVALQSRN